MQQFKFCMKFVIFASLLFCFFAGCYLTSNWKAQKWSIDQTFIASQFNTNRVDMLLPSTSPAPIEPKLPNNLAFKDLSSLFKFPRAKGVDCLKLFERDRVEHGLANTHQKNNPKVKITEDQIIEMTRDCENFTVDRMYVTHPVTMEEAEFPLAFSIVMFHDVEQFERLLRAIYRPQNYYCIHVDKKSNAKVHEAVKSIVRCFDNVFIAPTLFNMDWGTFSILQSELTCMEELLRRYKKWKYFINLTGQEFPLKTNGQIVEILKIFNGSNNLEGTVKRRNKERTVGKPPVPVNVTLTKGSVHVVATRKFVDYVVFNNDSLKFRDWVKDTDIPDETYFSSLNHSPQLGIPGSYLGIPETDTKKNLFITRFKNWGDGPFNWPCYGQRVRMVCVFAVGDLPLLYTRPELFANKFYLDYEPLALDCMEELHLNHTREEIMGKKLPINSSFYADLDFVRNHL